MGEEKARSSSSITTASPPTPDSPSMQSTKPSSPSLFSHDFWDKEPEITKIRRTFIKLLFQRTLTIVVAIFAIFPIYWGALWKNPARSLPGWIVDFDGDQVGSFVMQELLNNTQFDQIIHWQIFDASNFPNGPDDLAAAVSGEKCWAAVSINHNATLDLNRILNGTLTTFDSSNAITAFLSEARNENAYRTLLQPAVTTLLNDITHDYAIKFMNDFVTSARSLSTVNPDVLTRPIYFTLDNLHPFDVPIATAVTFIGILYLLILSFIALNAALYARTASGIEKHLSLGALIRVRLISPIIMYFFISLTYSLVTRAFQLPFNRHYGRAGFVLFWMLAWFGMMACGLALESMLTILTMKHIQVFLLLWIIGNVSVSLWPIDGLNILYRYGNAAPFYQVSRGVRSIIFGTRNQLGLNFGILIVWIAISSCTLPAFQWYRRREEKRAAVNKV